MLDISDTKIIDMHLCIDVGNTRWKTGIFKEGKLIHFRSFDSGEAFEQISSLLYNHLIDYTIYSSVSSVEEKIVRLLNTKSTLIQFDHNTPLPITNKYLSPKTLGLDRLAAVMGAYGLSKNSLIIDAGTCITYDLLTNNNCYLGGNIAPGIDMRFKAMHVFTDKLPLEEKQASIAPFGKTTKEAMESGVCLGICHEIEGFIHQYSADFQGLEVFLTGGDSNYLVEYLKKKIFVRPNLVLEGLSKILIHNVNEK